MVPFLGRVGCWQQMTEVKVHRRVIGGRPWRRGGRGGGLRSSVPRVRRRSPPTPSAASSPDPPSASQPGPEGASAEPPRLSIFSGRISLQRKSSDPPSFSMCFLFPMDQVAGVLVLPAS